MLNYNENSDWVENIAIVMQLGLTMSGSVLACLFLGRWLGDRLGYSGIFILFFTLFGIIGGANVCYRQIISAMISKRKKIDLL